MICPHSNTEITLEEIKKQITPDEIKKLWASLGGSITTDAKRLANAQRSKKRWADARAKGAKNGNE